MGYYINPKVGTKEQWLEANGKRISSDEARVFIFDGKELPVCLVDNFGAFTAAGIAYSLQERDAFIRPDTSYDGLQRPRVWFAVPKFLLEPWYKD